MLARIGAARALAHVCAAPAAFFPWIFKCFNFSPTRCGKKGRNAIFSCCNSPLTGKCFPRKSSLCLRETRTLPFSIVSRELIFMIYTDTSAIKRVARSELGERENGKKKQEVLTGSTSARWRVRVFSLSLGDFPIYYRCDLVND